MFERMKNTTIEIEGWNVVKFAGKEGGVGREEKLETMSWKAAAKLARQELVEPPCIYR